MDAKEIRPPTFMPGYPNLHAQQYMNVGYDPLGGGRRIYPHKTGQGDYGPSQGGHTYYDIYGNKNPWNPNYVYPLDYSPASKRVATLRAGYSENIPHYLRKY